MSMKRMTTAVAAAGIVGLCFSPVEAQRRRAEPTHAAVDTPRDNRRTRRVFFTEAPVSDVWLPDACPATPGTPVAICRPPAMRPLLEAPSVSCFHTA